MQNKLNNQWQWLIFLLLAILLPLSTAMAAGGIVTDGTVGPAQSLSGTNVTIPQNLGTTFGKNLFHSFNQFNVNNGQTVTFTENTPNALENVISRVTGGSASAIDGTLRSTPGGHANLYLVNPSGIVFGKNAQINVPGAFHASTADEVRFQDGAKFSASQPAGSTLTAAAPASFGFLGTSSATNGLLKVDGAQLEVGQGKKLDMVGRNISVDNGAKLSAPSGEVRLEAAGTDSMDIPINQPSEAAHGALALTKSTIDASGDGGGKVFIRGGNLKMDQDAKIFADTSGKQNGAKIDVHLTGDLEMNRGSQIFATIRELGSGNPEGITVSAKNIRVEGQVPNTDRQSGIATGAVSEGVGNAGSIVLKASEDILISGNSRLFSGVLPVQGKPSQVKAGNILFKARNVEVSSGATINSSNFTSEGGGGGITIQATDVINILGQGQFYDSSTGQKSNLPSLISSPNIGGGQAGKIYLQSSSLNIADHALILGATLGGGRGSDITVNVLGDMTMTGGGTINASSLGKGDAGNIHVKANNLLIDGQIAINGQTTFNGRSLYLNTGISSVTGNSMATEKQSTGKAGDIAINIANRLSLIRGGNINSSSFGSGNAGNITVNASQLLMDKQSALMDVMGNSLETGIFTDSARSWSGQGGVIEVTALDRMDLQGGKLSASTAGEGQGGTINLNTKHLHLTKGGQILTISLGSKDAGSIFIHDADDISIDGVADEVSGELITGEFVKGDFSGIYLNAQGSGNGGSLLILNTNHLSISDGGAISAVTLNAPTANTQGGNIDIHTRTVNLTGGALISASTSGLGKAGSVNLTATESVNISGRFEHNLHPSVTNPRVSEFSGISSSASYALDHTAKTLGSGGSVTVKVPLLKLDNQGEISVSAEGVGRAGNLKVETGKLFMDNGSRISAEALTGSGGKTGNVNITATDSISLSNQSKISIENAGFASVLQQTKEQQIKEESLFVSAPDIFLRNSEITTKSSQNNNARAIQVNFINQLFLDNTSYISSEANNGNGGNIDILGGQLIQLIDSGFKTNVRGQNGNGGNINLTAENLVMETGLIQANTAAPRASGGNINLNLEGRITSGGVESLIQGGNQPVPWQPYEFGRNVIQAAAPNGISGLIQSTAPQLDLSGVLSNLGIPQFDTRAISQDYCSLGTGSSLIRQGKGGLPPRSRDSVLY